MATAINKDILSAIKNQVDELSATGIEKKVKIDSIVQELTNLQTLIGGVAGDTNNLILSRVINQVKNIQSGVTGYEDFGPALGDLDTLSVLIPASVSATNNQVIVSIIAQIENLLNYR